MSKELETTEELLAVQSFRYFSAPLDRHLACVVLRVVRMMDLRMWRADGHDEEVVHDCMRVLVVEILKESGHVSGMDLERTIPMYWRKKVLKTMTVCREE